MSQDAGTAGDLRAGHTSTSSTAHDAANRTVSDQAVKPLGTGVFMPIVGRTCSNRSKPYKRRNASTSCLSTSTSRPQPRRNISTISLGAGQQLQHHTYYSESADACESEQPLIVPGHPHMLVVPSSGLSASATTVSVGSCQQSNSAGPQLLQQVMYQQQHNMPSFAMPSSGSSSSSASPSVGAVLSPEGAPMHACMSVPAGARIYSVSCAGTTQAASQYISAVQYNDSFLQAAGPCSSQGLAAEAQHTTLQLPALAMPGAVVCPDALLGASSTAPICASLSFSGPEGAAALASGMLASNNKALLPGPLSSADSIMTQCAALGLSQEDVLSLLTQDANENTNLIVQQDEIRQHINKLSLMKQLLHLKQQHKAQQRTLQLQQLQQEQALQQELLQLQQQLLQSQASGKQQCNETQQLQQELLQLLQMRGGDAVPLCVSVSSAPEPVVHVSATGVAVGQNGALTNVSASANASGMYAVLPQQQLPQQQLHMSSDVLQTANAATLGSLLQERLTLRHQQVPVLSAPSNLFTHQPQPAVLQQNVMQAGGMQVAVHLAHPGGVLPGWGL